MTAQRDADRPFRNYTAEQLLDAGRQAFRRQDRPALLAAILELDEYRTSREAERAGDELHELLDRLAPGSGPRRRGAAYCRECSGTIGKAEGYYCEGCGSARWAQIERDVQEIRSRAAHGVYVGRSAYPERRLLQHVQKRRSWLSILHWAGSLEEAEAYETRIHTLVADISKQKQPRPGGKFARCHHAVYVSWMTRSSFPAAQLAPHVSVKRLLAARQWPAPPSRFETMHLSCPLTPHDAKGMLAELDAREQRHLDDRRGG